MSDPWGDVPDTEHKNKVSTPASGVPEETKVQVPDPWVTPDNSEYKDEDDWTKTNYDSTAPRGDRRPRAGRPRGEHRGRSDRGRYRARDDDRSGNRPNEETTRGYDYPQEYRGRNSDDRRSRGRFPRGRFHDNQRGRGGGRYIGERTKIKRHKLFENNHNQEVIYREDEQQIDPDKLSTQSHFRSNRNWDELSIPPNILTAIEEIGYVYPSKIQSFGIDVILQEGYENLIAQAPNGSGKTATFIIGSLCRLDFSNPKIQIICISHTIELTNQIFQEYSKITQRIGVTISVISKDSKPSDHGQVVVTVAGSFLKAIRTKSLDLSDLKVFVVDEADHLFDIKNSQEFYNTLTQVVKNNDIPSNVQFLLFSATFSDQVKTDIVKLLKEMNEITIKKEELMLDLIKHFYIVCDQKEKISKFESVLKRVTRGITIAFVNTCDFARLVCNRINTQGHKTALLMGRDMSLDERNLTMQDFRAGKYGVLITTNLLARGIDNTKVTCVINFDLPRIISTREMDYTLYLHRSGRCSRFGRTGVCFNLITNDAELTELKTIEEYYSIDINELQNIDDIEGLFNEPLTEV
jgi:ATP-dependent RNA helicase DDX19/DBP5